MIVLYEGGHCRNDNAKYFDDKIPAFPFNSVHVFFEALKAARTVSDFLLGQDICSTTIGIIVSKGKPHLSHHQEFRKSIQQAVIGLIPCGDLL